MVPFAGSGGKTAPFERLLPDTDEHCASIDGHNGPRSYYIVTVMKNQYFPQKKFNFSRPYGKKDGRVYTTAVLFFEITVLLR